MSEHTILFVDDEQSILKSLRRLFIDEQYEILLANSGQEALEMIDQGAAPTVIVSDQRMPHMGGAEFLALAREKLPDSIRMVLTGYADINAAMEAINRGGIYRYIMKPWNDDDLKLSVADAVERFDLVRRNRQLTAELKEKNKILEDLNATLEQKVRERTSQLRAKVKELKGRDVIQQHLLTIHPLAETLQVVVDVVQEVLSADEAAIYLDKEEGGNLELAASKIHSQRVGLSPLLQQQGGGLQCLADLSQKLLQSKSPAHYTGKDLAALEPPPPDLHFCLAPLFKGERGLGILMAVRHSEHNFSQGEADSLMSFGMQSAIAINDSLMSDQLPALESALDEVLSDLDLGLDQEK